jgi:hypothetical protein
MSGVGPNRVVFVMTESADSFVRSYDASGDHHVLALAVLHTAAVAPHA